MCVEYIINDGIISDKGQLLNLIGTENSDLLLDSSGRIDLSSCLCGVDVDQIAMILMQSCVYDGIDWYFGENIKKVKQENIKKTISMEELKELNKRYMKNRDKIHEAARLNTIRVFGTSL